MLLLPSSCSAPPDLQKGPFGDVLAPLFWPLSFAIRHRRTQLHDVRAERRLHLLQSLERDGELRDVQGEFSEYYYVCYMLSPLIQIFMFQSLSMSLLLNLLFEPDPYSKEY